ncbi:MAG: LUD domain-containing protein [Acidobacteria bacterium]|nr:LUD domain-containing protein [Acidobacteriota bacterium]
MSAREEVLGRIRSALRDAPEAPQVPRDYRTTSARNEEELIEQLVERLEDYKATAHVLTLEQVPAHLAKLLAGQGRYAVPQGLNAAFFADLDTDDEDGARRIVDGVPSWLTAEQLDAVDAVVTGSAVAIAETGTIILNAGADQGRRIITLVPDRHICLIKSKDIVGILPEALPRLDAALPQTWISGPSATSDIELERVEGVHGPRTLDVVIVRP